MMTGIDGCWRECETAAKKSSVSRCDAYFKKLRAEMQESSANVKHVANGIADWIADHKHIIGIIVLSICLLLFWPFLVGRAVIREIRKVIHFPF